MLLLFTVVLFTLRFTSMLLPDGNFVRATPTAMSNIAKPGCRPKCGNLTVRYPFGIDKGCSLDESFELTCDLNHNPPKLFIGSGNIDIYSIEDTEISIFNSVAYQCYNKSGEGYDTWITLEESFPISHKNKFTVIGCDDYVWIRGPDGSEYASGCMGMCSNGSHVPNDGNCTGIGCCQTSIPKGLKYFNASLGFFNNHTDFMSFNPCGIAFLAD